MSGVGPATSLWSPMPARLWKSFLSCGPGPCCSYAHPLPRPLGQAGLLASSLGKESPMPVATPAMWAVGAATGARNLCSRCCCVLA